MKNLPDSVVELRDYANVCSDEHHDAWEKLNEIETPTLQDVEQWLEVKNRFHSAQEAFEEKLSSFLKSGLNA
ncbi:hypothetical protein EI534_25885 [Pseudomonas frederiksbergensis]|nr:hypothetical protein [Pseudomonas frederiksbergensis]